MRWTPLSLVLGFLCSTLTAAWLEAMRRENEDMGVTSVNVVTVANSCRTRLGFFLPQTLTPS